MGPGPWRHDGGEGSSALVAESASPCLHEKTTCLTLAARKKVRPKKQQQVCTICFEVLAPEPSSRSPHARRTFLPRVLLQRLLRPGLDTPSHQTHCAPCSGRLHAPHVY